jgi:AcrR family transcriptional regulator
MAPRETATPRRSSGTSGRTPWGTISREQIVEAALRAIRQPGGYEQMTIRSLAADLGVAPMSLYRHVRDKDDLLDEVVDRLLARAWRPRRQPDDWKAWIAEAADKLRQFLVSQPAALHVYLSHPVVSPAAIARMEAVMGVLRSALSDERAARRAYAAIHTYTIGFAALEASRDGWEPSAAGGKPLSDLATVASRAVPEADAPPAEMASVLAAYTTPRQFADGLRYLLDGIDSTPSR